MVKSIPDYVGTWKGRVIKAIAFEGAKTWNEIRESTGLYANTLNLVLRELFDAGVLEKNDKGEYRVEYALYKNYKDYFEDIEEKEEFDPTIRITEEIQQEYSKWIDIWKDAKKLSFSLKNKHFYLEERFLDDFSKDLIANGKKEVLAIGPYVSTCSLSNTLRKASKKGAVVKIILRPTKDVNEADYHKILQSDKVIIHYNSKVHAKIIVVDRAVAIVSSMNFTVHSSGGQSWEAGLVTTNPDVVQNIVDSILRLMELPETKIDK